MVLVHGLIGWGLRARTGCGRAGCMCMPLKVSKINGKYRVERPATQDFSPATDKRRGALSRAIKHGWVPESAQQVVRLLLDGDAIGSVPIPAAGKAYARIHGMRGLKKKQNLFINMCRDLGNPGESTRGFRNRDGTEMGESEVDRPLERSHVERTRLHGGRYGTGVARHGKTAGKFKFPKNYTVGHAIKT